MEDDEEQTTEGHALYWVNVVSGVVGVGYYFWLMTRSGEAGVVPFKNKVLHFGGNVCEKIAASAWTGALKLRTAYNEEVKG